MKKMIDLYFKYKEVIRYLVFGVLTTLVNIITYDICAHGFGLDFRISTIIAWIIAVIFAYVTNKIYVFDSKNKNIIKEMISFFGFRLVSLGIDYLIMEIFVGTYHFNDLFVKVMANVIVIILNYVFSKLFIFNKK